MRAELCHAMWSLCGGVRVELDESHRSDKTHFNYYSLYRRLGSWQDWVGGHAGACKDLEERYPWSGQLPDVCITISHEKREYMAMVLNECHKAKALEAGLEAHLIKADVEAKYAPIKPHKQMWLWKGVFLLGCTSQSRRSPVKNSCPYVVARVSEEEVVVKPCGESEKEIKLSHKEALIYLRLACARTAASVQGITLQDQRLLLLDVRSRHMTHRHLYVCISRVTRGDLLHVATQEQQATLLRGLGQSRPPAP